MMTPSPQQARRWHGRQAWQQLEDAIGNRWLSLSLAGLTVLALALAAAEVELGGGGLNLAFGVGLLALLAWSAVGLRAAVGEPELRRWRRLLALAEISGAIAGVDVAPAAGRKHAAPALADVAPDAHLVLVDPLRHVALPMPDGSSDAVVFGPRVAALDEATRETLLDDAHRALRPGGHLVLVLPNEERRSWLRVAPVEWMPGSPPGWWADALAERFEEVRHAALSGRLDVILARKARPTPAS